ncbi:UDP-N-acetyl-D-mannosamine dehydrogenase [Falsigemmobacter faecalis]|uniref:UDP-N-acetyl-D-mannosamine dehydrogenase n=2 Tax=Falsigemmobacter faecalis TaxID=2488730 RepID=A0A3P3D1K9_9RHOB|nr:UDP-N-acetyl-D-mannosamine dehydrogenase [Falsigemmobacter faecalis]
MKTAEFKRISVIGLGYIGLPTAAMFASRGVEVVGVDVNPKAVDIINRGEIHIIEPDLDIVVRSVVQQGKLRATLTAEPADAFIVAVPTPFKGDNHDPDLRYIEAAAKSIAPVLKQGDLVILESTSPVGATEAMSVWLAESRPDLSFPQHRGEESDIRIAHCPERVLPGKVMQELITNDRVIGGMTALCSERASELYRLFVTGKCVIASSTRIAEMAKLTENSFRDVNIAFANELSLICDKIDIDVWELISLANRHPRVNILQPGPGVGGHCIAVDPWFIVSSAPEQAKLIRTARNVNDSKPDWVIQKVREAIREHFSHQKNVSSTDIKIVVYGIAFKPDIDDLRESPAIHILKNLISENLGHILVVEPNIDDLPEALSNAELIDLDDANGDIHVMLVDHTPFRGMPTPSGSLVDIRGVWS